MPAVIEWGKIGQVIWVSAVAGVLVTALFSVAIYGVSRAAESRRTGTGPTGAFGALAAAALAGFAGVVVFAITVILQKS
jgi:hypothetical protein